MKTSFARKIRGLLLVTALAVSMGTCHRAADPLVSERRLSEWITSLDDRDNAVQLKAIHAIGKLARSRRRLADGTYAPRERATDAEAARLPLQQLCHNRTLPVGVLLAAQHDLLTLFQERDSSYTEMALRCLAWDESPERYNAEALLENYPDKVERITDVALVWVLASWMQNASHQDQMRGVIGGNLLRHYADVAWPKISKVEPMGSTEATMAYLLWHEVAVAKKQTGDQARWRNELQIAKADYVIYQDKAKKLLACLPKDAKPLDARKALDLLLHPEFYLHTKATDEERCLYYRQQGGFWRLYVTCLEVEKSLIDQDDSTA